MDRQTLRDWVHRFNAEGPEGLYDKQRPGTSCRLSEAQQQELAAIIEAGPDLAEHGVVRFRLCDLCALVEERFGVTYQEPASAPSRASCESSSSRWPKFADADT